MISMISTAIGDICISLAGNYIQSMFCNYLSSIKWYDLFAKVKHELIESYEKYEVIIKTIEIVLDNDELKRLEEKYKNYRDVKLIDSIRNDITFSFRKYIDNEKIVDELVDRFIDALLFHIRTYDSDLYNNICFYQEMLKTEEQVRLLVEKDKEITISACSLWQIEDRLRKGNKYNIDLDFFDFDEQDVDDSIIQELKNESVIYIKAEDQEEGLLYLLRLFKYIPNLCDNVMIIKDEASWEWADKLLRGKILIPLFESTQITPSQR